MEIDIKIEYDSDKKVFHLVSYVDDLVFSDNIIEGLVAYMIASEAGYSIEDYNRNDWKLGEEEEEEKE